MVHVGNVGSKVVKLVRTGNLGAALENLRRARMGHPRLLLPHPMPGDCGDSARRINTLYRGMPAAQRYLEIGLELGFTFEHVQLPVRVGVDPYPLFDIERLPHNVSVSVATSDEFFSGAEREISFDIVFLDGLHTYRQTYRDLINALRVCRSGVIIIDDVVPIDEVSAMPDIKESRAERKRRGLPDMPWHGDVFKVVLCLRDHHSDLRIRTIVGSGNPQALVWRPHPAMPCPSVDDSILGEFDDVSFTDVFADGPPDFFVPSAESDAIADALRDVSGRFVA